VLSWALAFVLDPAEGICCPGSVVVRDGELDVVCVVGGLLLFIVSAGLVVLGGVVDAAGGGLAAGCGGGGAAGRARIPSILLALHLRQRLLPGKEKKPYLFDYSRKSQYKDAPPSYIDSCDSFSSTKTTPDSLVPSPRTPLGGRGPRWWT